ncbi:MAG: thermonuclease family protein [Prochlorococcaceae cyanobacterium]
MLALLALLAAAIAPYVAAGQPRRLSATVLSIGDGDSLRVRQGKRTLTVRLACIDAPETSQIPHGPQARDYLQLRLPPGRPVTLAVKASDQYGRLVAEVISDINIGLLMVDDGQAFAYRRYLGGCNAKEYLDAEYRASRHRYGVWQVPGGIIRPWDFRRGQRQGAGRLEARRLELSRLEEPADSDDQRLSAAQLLSKV